MLFRKFSFKIPIIKRKIIIEKYIGKTLPKVSIEYEDEYYLKIYNELKKKYPNIPDYIIRRAAKTGYNWLMGMVEGMSEQYKKVIIERELDKAIKVSERWLEDWVKEMYD